MTYFSEEITINSNPEQVFTLYEDVANWSSWDPDVSAASLSGPFSPGTSGTLKPARGPESRIQLVHVDNNKAFTVQSKLPLCTLTFEHELFPDGSTTRVIHRVSFEGPLSFLFGRIIGGQIRKGLPGTLRGLKQAVEQRPG